MKKILTAVCGASALLVAAPASATVYGVGSVNAGAPAEAVNFAVTPIGGTIFTAPIIVGAISNIISVAGTYTDDFQFTIPQKGVGSGSITTSSTNINFNGLTFNSATFNGHAITPVPNGAGGASISLTNVPITLGAVNDLIINFTAGGAGASFGGNLTFQSVPEPATWAMFLLGFGVLGFALRRKRAEGVRVRFAF